ncbi:MAG: GatB/YqeY domain-containing protein [Bacteroidota bacterium]|nr:GatB/YqeY domain-containing protein [Bacteroidota bacterium]
MSLQHSINSDIKHAMLAKEKEKLAALRSIKAALLLEMTKEGGDGSVNDETALRVLQKLFKQRKDAAKIYQEQNRLDLADVEIKEASFIASYLPKMMSKEKIQLIVKETINQLGAKGPSEMGKVMGAVMGKLKGKADGGLISSVVKEELNK